MWQQSPGDKSCKVFSTSHTNQLRQSIHKLLTAYFPVNHILEAVVDATQPSFLEFDGVWLDQSFPHKLGKLDQKLCYLPFILGRGRIVSVSPRELETKTGV